MHLQIVIVLVVVLSVIVAYRVFGRILPARWGKRDAEESEPFTIESASVLIGSSSQSYSAFVIAGVLDDYNNAHFDVQQANAIGAIYGYARGFPEPAESTWENDSRRYTTLVINQDWPLMQHQQSSEVAWTALTALRNDSYTFHAADGREQGLQDKAIGKGLDAYGARRTRVDLIDGDSPNFLWFTLLGRAALVALFPLFTKPHLTARLLIAVAIQGLMIAGALYLVTVLNHPFTGSYRVEPNAFEILLNRFHISR